MSKQDRQGVRNLNDLERKYNFERSFAEAMGIATDAQKSAKNLESEKLGKNDSDRIVDMINASTKSIKIKGYRLIIESDNFELTKDGKIIVNAGRIGGCEIDEEGYLQIKNANISEKLTADKINAEDMEIMRAIIGGWHLGTTDIQVNGSNLISDQIALYSDEMTEKKPDGDGVERMYTYRAFLTPYGVYVHGRYDTSGESAVPYWASRSWLDICENRTQQEQGV